MPKLIGWSVLGAVIVFLLWAGSAAILCQYVPESTARGTFGDMFGAINALFSGWAFLGVVIAIILQRQELEMQRQEIRESRIAQQASANAQHQSLEIATFLAEIESLNHLISGCSRRIQRVRNFSNLDEHNEHDRLLKEIATYEDRLRVLIQKRIDIS
jgi:hypothetical protein